ncbi:hypothetical protein DL93DRAFT_2087487 [Clavulina sp. PMI_390]|nr:hypothetical protein DL93DRAFT_2087487 [Clavulina sp. PMI_390]
MVKSFPSEIIIDVLLFVCEGIDHGNGLDHPEALQSRLHVSQVCSSWRKLVINSSRFWTNVTWYIKAYRHINYRITIIPKQISSLLYALELFLERSSDAPIDLWVSLNGVPAHEGSCLDRILPEWDVIGPHVHRCRSLKLMKTSDMSSWYPLFPLRGEFPYLTHLRIERSDIPDIFQLRDAAPRLLHVCLDQGYFSLVNASKGQSKTVSSMAFTREKERQGYHSNPYWDVVDRALVDRSPTRNFRSRPKPYFPSLPSPNSLVVRVRHAEPRTLVALFPHLQHVIIAKTRVTFALLEDIGDLPDLETLTFARCTLVPLGGVNDNKFLRLQHLIFQECEDLQALDDLNWNSTNFPALLKFTSRCTMRWKWKWEGKWTKVFHGVLRTRPNLVFEWFYRTREGRRRRPFWNVDALGDVADRVVELRADEVDQFDWVEPNHR